MTRSRASRRSSAGGAVSGQRLRARAEVELDAVRDSNALGSPIEAHAPPAGRAEAVGRRRAVGTELGEVAVVPEVPDRPSDGRVDGAVGCARDAQRDLDRLHQEIADPDHLTCRLVHPRELGVVAEPAAGTVDPVELGLEQLAGADDRAGLRHENGCRGPERRPARRGDHSQEPPETLGAGAGAGTGAGAGVGAAAGGEREGEDAVLAPPPCDVRLSWARGAGAALRSGAAGASGVRRVAGLRLRDVARQCAHERDGADAGPLRESGRAAQSSITRSATVGPGHFARIHALKSGG